ncbi:hypothetical protein ACOMHN_032366 [Nucella lapillus]
MPFKFSFKAFVAGLYPRLNPDPASMAEGGERRDQMSMYGHEIQQVSQEEWAPAGTDASPSPTNPTATSTVGSEFGQTCGICLRGLTHPRQLKSCYHIFCRDCLQPLVDKAQGEEVACPLGYCSRKCPKEDISKALRSDTYLHDFQGDVCAYAESGELTCSNDAIKAAYFCLNCGQNFCETCQIDHGENPEFKSHILLRLFQSRSALTVGIKRASPLDEPDLSPSQVSKCPICRNTDCCEHERWLKDLSIDTFRTNASCDIPEHQDGRALIAFCSPCNIPICRNCSSIEHKNHKTLNISNATGDKLTDLRAMKKCLAFQLEMFKDAAAECRKAESKFRNHMVKVEQEMVHRKSAMHSHVESAFDAAFTRIEATGRKQAELNRQSEDMRQEEKFLRTAIGLADNALAEGANPLEVVRVWKGLDLIWKGMGDGEGEGKKEEKVFPQRIVEKRLVVPAASCMNPDLRILGKVGVEGTVLRHAFTLEAFSPHKMPFLPWNSSKVAEAYFKSSSTFKAETELLLFYSILPLTQTEALVSCMPRSGVTDLVQYSNMRVECLGKERCNVTVAEGGEYCFTAAPGLGIVATLFDAPSGCGDLQGKSQVLFWQKALGVSMTKLETKGARVIATTTLPVRGLAMTSDNHVVVCMASKPPPHGDKEERQQESCIHIMTLQGDVLNKRDFRSQNPTPDHCNLYSPRYVTVNINSDICVTDERNHSVIIFDRHLKNKLRMVNPYNKDRYKRFAPRGICHDAFGRLIVADPDNNTVVRIEYDDVNMTGFEVILENDFEGVKNLNTPQLVAMGKGVTDESSRLWVVCRDNIQVFEYTDKE